MLRKKLIAANWKLHKTVAEAETFAFELKRTLGDLPDRDLVIFPTFVSLAALARALRGTRVAVGAQDVFWENEGAYTGEISARQILDAGGTHVIVGHSERREVFEESDEVIARKLAAALDAGVTPILCVGEKLEEREKGRAGNVVRFQLERGLEGLPAESVSRVVVAYEPVWAIGTGRNASPEDAEGMHRMIRAFLSERFGTGLAAKARILYGGSVNPANAAGLLERKEIDGALIGGASLLIDSFVAIIQAGVEPRRQ